MITALCAQGYSYSDLTDYDRGPDMETLAALNVQASRFSLIREKREVNALCLSLTSLFKADILQKYFESIDSMLDETELADSPDPVKAEAKKLERRSKRSMQNLSKLNKLMSR